MNNWMKALKTKAILPAVVLLAAAAIGTTFAWQTWQAGITNELNAHQTDIEVKEEFTPYEKKKVWFKNTGTSCVFLRVSYVETWKKDGLLLSNEAGDREVAEKLWTPAWGDPNLWEPGDDGWYYYKKVLKAGAETDSVLENVVFEHLPEEYQNAEYGLYFQAEAVQCSDGSSTLNSAEVNRRATRELFGREAMVTGDDVTWTD